MIPESRPMSYSRGEITTFVMPHMQNVLGDLFGGRRARVAPLAPGERRPAQQRHPSRGLAAKHDHLVGKGEGPQVRGAGDSPCRHPTG